MAKTRMMKPDLRWSEKVASWPIPVRYFWTLLWGYVDDHGKGKDNPLLVKADCFPLDEDITSGTVDEWLWLLAASDVVVRYETLDGRFLAVKNWREHQKPQHPTADVLPGWDAPGATIRTVTEPLMNPSCITHEPLTPELSRDGFGIEKGGHRTVTVPFETFWDIWEKRVAKADARKAWDKAVRIVDPAVIVAAAQALWASPYRPAKQFIPHPATWLNKQQWTDPAPEPPEDERRAEKPTLIAPRAGECRHRYVEGYCANCSEREP